MTDTEAPGEGGWWSNRWLVLLVVVVAAVPFAGPKFPPLADFFGHLGRYYLQLNLDHDPALSQFYSFHWGLIGNLGVDLLIEPVSRVFGLVLGAKLIVMTIPVLAAAGLLLVARVVHGSIPPTAFFALPLAYANPLQLGFVNFSLSVGLAWLAFAGWVWLGQRDRRRLRALIFVALSVVIWLTHIYGWAMLCVLAFAAEYTSLPRSDIPMWRRVWAAGLACLSLAPPFLLFALSASSQGAAGARDWFNLPSKMQAITFALRDRWQVLDTASVILIIVLIGIGLGRRHFERAPALAMASVMFLAAFAALPYVLLGSAFADSRLIPILLATAILMLRPKTGMNRQMLSLIAVAGLCFFGVRLAAHTLSYAKADAEIQRQLAALSAIPKRSKVVALYGPDMSGPWAEGRVSHIQSMLLLEKQSFSNEQFILPGGQLLRLERAPFPDFRGDPSQMVVMDDVPFSAWRQVDQMIALAGRNGAELIWIVNDPRGDRPQPQPWLRELWRDGASVVYRVVGPVPG
jgi:hypothetical protein